MVNVDTVYQRVLALANKEQRGYVTPQEFNLLANQAQLDIFEQYFYDINQFAQINDVGMEYSDAIDSLEEKMAIFETTGGVGAAGILPSNLYKLGTVIWDNKEVEQIGQKKYLYINSSPLAKPKNDRPVYTRNGNVITVYGDSQITSGITCNYIKKPNEVAWGYNVIAQKALYNASSSTNFELHSSEEVKLVIKILELAGIIINKPGLVSIAAQKEANKLQQEKA
jgi:hypothetical protein|tara:strand:+ start:165 stop:839 length:675 start_codon:yes stop_codon:yes gene_type:complete